MRVACIGQGSIGRRHAANLLALGCEVGRFDVLARGEIRSAYESLAMTDWDAVVIATPWDTHLWYAEWAEQWKTPFFVEKPLGSLEQLPRWRQLVKDTAHLPTQVGYQLRFHPRYLAMRQWVPKPNDGWFQCYFNIATWHGKSYGPPKLEASHELDLALDCGLSTKHTSLIDGSSLYHRGWWIRDDAAEISVSFSSAEELGDQMYVDEMAHFLECVREGKQTRVPLSDGVRVLEALCQS